MGKFIPNGNESTFSSETLGFFSLIFHSTFAHFLLFSISKATAKIERKTMKIVVGAFFVPSSQWEIYKNIERNKKGKKDSVKITMLKQEKANKKKH